MTESCAYRIPDDDSPGNWAFERASAPIRHARPSRPQRTSYKNTILKSGTETLPARAQIGGKVPQMLSERDVVREFRCPEANRKKVCDLLWLAFPAPSAHGVQQRAAAALGRDPRTIRYWMEGATRPRWDELCIIAGFAGLERAIGILFRE